MLVFKLLRAVHKAVGRAADIAVAAESHTRTAAVNHIEDRADRIMQKAAIKWYRAREAADEAALVAQELRNDLARVGDFARWERDEAVRSL